MIGGAGKCTGIHSTALSACQDRSCLHRMPHQNCQQLCINLFYLQMDVRNLREKKKKGSCVELVDELDMTKQGVLLSKKRCCISKVLLLQMKSFK